MAMKLKYCKDRGYRTSLVLVLVSLTSTHIRNATRDRNVPAPNITIQYNLIKNNFAQLRSIADKSTVVINDNPASDVKRYNMNPQKVDDHIRKGYNGEYSGLKELIQSKAPGEVRQWEGKLNW